MDGRSEACVGFVVTGGDAAEFLEPLETVFDQVPPFVHLAVMRNGRRSIRLRRDDGGGAPFVQCSAQGVVVESLVPNQRIKIDVRDQRLDADAVVALAGKKDEAAEIAKRIDERDDLRRQAAARAAYGLILSPPFAPAPCLWTRTMVPSTIAYSKSGSFDNSLKMRPNTPFRAHLRKRFHTEPHLPKPLGRSRHGAPVRTSHSTASRNKRLSRPVRPGSPVLPGRRGAMRVHCASLNSFRSKADLHCFSLESNFQPEGNPLSSLNVYRP